MGKQFEALNTIDKRLYLHLFCTIYRRLYLSYTSLLFVKVEEHG